MTPKLEKILIELSNKLGTSIDSIYTAMLNQAKLHVYYNLFFFCFMLFINLSLSYLTFYINKRIKIDNKDPFFNPLYICMFLTVFSYFLSFVFFVENSYNVFTAFYNPEYWVLLKISNMFIGN